jgi:geranyl-CoA carboxylase alpha subunit
MSKTPLRPDPAPLATTTQPAPSSPPTSAATHLIRKVLVANRGEIARRVIRTCREMGIATVAVFSDADATAAHVREADEAMRIGPPAATASYLNIPALIAAAARTHADAVHPGYGFLAENAAFATACHDAGLIFIGPAPDVIARMGSKREARRLMAAAGVPVVPGYDGTDQSDVRFAQAAREIGYPVLVKASAGGGGKGMRTVRDEDELAAALAGARREALAAFGDATLLLEKLIDEPRHVEFQIFGDTHGSLIHLGERECTIQRRHQKIVEETPSPALTPELRARMGAAAVTVGRQLGYTNAGTVEFILAPSGNFYFLEVNTRLQVEHPVTELVTGLDLVRWQILVAAGHPLPLAQDVIPFSGHAVEVRLYAEDPAAGFLPQTGPVARWRPVAEGTGVRVDAGIQTGDAVTPHYDPLLAKISAHGANREEALRRLEHALARTLLLGLRTNQDYLRRVLLHPAHLSGQISTAFVERHTTDLLAPADQPVAGLPGDALAAVAVSIHRMPDRPGATGWRNNPGPSPLQRYTPLRDDADHTIGIRVTPAAGNHLAVSIVSEYQERTLDALVHARSGDDLAVEIDGRLVHAVCAQVAPGEWWVRAAGATHALRWIAPLPEPSPSAFTTAATPATHAASTARRDTVVDGAILAPMPGQVVAVAVAEGQAVRVGDPLVILEAMKMEHTVRAPRDGIVAALRCRPGNQVAPRAVLLELHPLDHPTS